MKKQITLEQARKALGNEAVGLTDKQIMQITETVQVLCHQWNEAYQRTIFQGKTVNELLII